MVAVMEQLDIDYDHLFTCPICCHCSHDQLVLTTDGKEMGMQRAHEKPYVRPVDTSVVAQEISYVIQTADINWQHLSDFMAVM
jgi:hypothetical protein